MKKISTSRGNPMDKEKNVVIDDMPELNAKINEDLQAEKKGTAKEENLANLREYRKNRDFDLRNKIVEDNLGLVVSLAHSYSKSTAQPVEDLIQEGSLGLMKAVDDFDPDKGFAFSTFAVPYIKNAIRRYISQNGRMVALPSNIQTQIRKLHKTQETLSETLDREPTLEEIAAAMGPGYTTDSIRDLMINSYESYSLDKPSQNSDDNDSDGTNLFDSIPDDSEETPKEAAEAAERSQRFTEALKTLSGRELEVLLRRYGIGKPSRPCRRLPRSMASPWNASVRLSWRRRRKSRKRWQAT
jgi:RNA polymerase sigma factor (sigma-70 family)